MSGQQPWVHILACPACQFATLVVNSLNEHIAGRHGGQEISYTLYVCPVCDACSTDSRLIDEHLAVYHGGGSLGEHQQLVHHPQPHQQPHRPHQRESVNTVEAHACPTCRLVFASLAAIRGHTCRMRSDEAATKAAGEEVEEADPLMERLLALWSGGGAAAVASGEDNEAVEMMLEDSNEAPRRPSDIDEPEPSVATGDATRQCPAVLRCPACPNRCHTLRTLSGHQLRCHGCCRCPVCDAVAFTVDSAVGHFAEEHRGHALYRCPRCERAFDQHDGLLQHWAAEHSRDVFKCPFCSRTFLQERYRTRHVRQVHPAQLATVQPCPQCPGVVMRSIEELRRHLRDAHGDPGEGEGAGRLRCGVCGRSFLAERSLRLHELSHRAQPAPFACSLCPYTCNTRYLLRCHVRDKHTDFTYDCGLCRARLLSRYLLRKHLNKEHGLADATAAVRAAASLSRKGGGVGVGGGRV